MDFIIHHCAMLDIVWCTSKLVLMKRLNTFVASCGIEPFVLGLNEWEKSFAFVRLA